MRIFIVDMITITKINSVIFCLAMSLCGFTFQDLSSDELFEKLNKLDWKMEFTDSFEYDWEKNWVLDGKNARISTNNHGMSFWAGNRPWQDEDHAVLWTRKKFEGDIRIEWDYTRLDSTTNMVTIIYFHAEGNDSAGFDKNIHSWSHQRIIPSMKTYFDNMDLIHVSYAAFTNDQKVGEQYLRARRYRPDLKTGLKGTDLGGFENINGFFETGVKHHLVLIKRGKDIVMSIANPNQQKVYRWSLDGQPDQSSGHIGLRHMYTRGALYQNFNVSLLGK